MLRKIFTKAPKTGAGGIFNSGLSRNKSSATRLKEELLSNPEFDSAFPHLREHKPNTSLPRDKKELDFIRSLFYRWRTTGKIDTDEIIKANVKRFYLLSPRLRCFQRAFSIQMGRSKLWQLSKRKKSIFLPKSDSRNSRRLGKLSDGHV